MADIKWLFNRLQAMSIPEVIWRISRKLMQKKEEKLFKSKPAAVVDRLFNDKLKGLSFQSELLFLNYKNNEFAENQIQLLGGFDYNKYKKDWFGGFQTHNKWNMKFSYNLEYKQRDDIGDARTNWELNRHFQFAILAENYYVTNDKKYLDEFILQFEDWNEKNPFLWGISYVSVMEIAIRASNWCYACAFLSKAENVPCEIIDKLKTGILNMTDYISNHYSRYSSANNHLIVEAYAIGQSGILFGFDKWVEAAVKILTRELVLQNYPDGINKELSLHYQSFYMEAMGLMLRLLKKNNIPVPESWENSLDKMCMYVADCMGKYGEIVEFGDNDEGKILDLQGGKINHYKYVLEIFSCLLNKKYCDFDHNKTIRWLFTDDEIIEAKKKPLYNNQKSVCYKEGGNSVLRSNDGKILIGIDHGDLGFGSIAAHGHADALSFQLFYEGESVFADIGTYIYHCDLKSRNYFRKTENHNTVSIGDKDQSEMLGAFLWGKKAKCKLLEYSEYDDKIVLKAEHNGYQPCIHRRTFEFDKKSTLRITDEFNEKGEKYINFVFGPDINVKLKDNRAYISSEKINGSVKFDGSAEITDKFYSPCYGIKQSCKGLKIKTCELKSETLIKFY